MTRQTAAKPVQTLTDVVIRFAGDSGDGMQLTGDRFTVETAAFGNSLSTLPDFPAEIRAPAGTMPGVSAFQVHFADHSVVTPGDAPTVLVAMNPAALKANIGDLPRGGIVIVDTDEFTKRNLAKVGYAVSPIDDGSLSEYQVHAVQITSMTVEAVSKIGLSRKDAERSKNMFALGLLSWLYHRPLEGTRQFLETKFAGKRRGAAGQPGRAGGWLVVRRDHRGLRRQLRGEAGGAAGRPVPHDPRQSGARVRPGGRVRAVRAAAVPRLVPDHPGLRHPARAQRVEELQRADVPGRGRDRRGRGRARRLLRRQPRGDDHLRARASR